MAIFALVAVLSLTGADCNIVQNVLNGEKATELDKDDVLRSVTEVANILAGVAGTVALIFLIYGGIMYIGSAGNQETAGKAKQTATNAIFGLILIACSWVIVRWFMSFVSTGTVGF